MVRNCGYGSCKVKIQLIFLVMSQGIDAVIDACNHIINIIFIYIILRDDNCTDCNGRSVFVKSVCIL